MKWILVGPRGSGKSTVGKLLSNQWQIPLCDLDDWITKKSGKSPNQWIEENLEAEFRFWEAKLLREWCLNGENGLLATGGGAVVDKNSQTMLEKFNPVIWLKNSPKSRLEVQKKAPRARLREGSLEKEIFELDDLRSHIYQKVSDHHINTDLSLSDILQQFEELRAKII